MLDKTYPRQDKARQDKYYTRQILPKTNTTQDIY